MNLNKVDFPEPFFPTIAEIFLILSPKKFSGIVGRFKFLRINLFFSIS